MPFFTPSKNHRVVRSSHSNAPESESILHAVLFTDVLRVICPVGPAWRRGYAAVSRNPALLCTGVPNVGILSDVFTFSRSSRAFSCILEYTPFQINPSFVTDISKVTNSGPPFVISLYVTVRVAALASTPLGGIILVVVAQLS